MPLNLDYHESWERSFGEGILHLHTKQQEQTETNIPSNQHENYLEEDNIF